MPVTRRSICWRITCSGQDSLQSFFLTFSMTWERSFLKSTSFGRIAGVWLGCHSPFLFNFGDTLNLKGRCGTIFIRSPRDEMHFSNYALKTLHAGFTPEISWCKRKGGKVRKSKIVHGYPIAAHFYYVSFDRQLSNQL